LLRPQPDNPAASVVYFCSAAYTDDAVIPATGEIEIAIAGFNGVSGKRHSVSETLLLKTSAKGS